jgi:hypothetical protein
LNEGRKEVEGRQLKEGRKEVEGSCRKLKEGS